MMTGHIYRDGILEQHVHLFRGAMGAEFLCMDDNVRPHHANIVDECLQSEDITRPRPAGKMRRASSSQYSFITLPSYIIEHGGPFAAQTGGIKNNIAARRHQPSPFLVCVRLRQRSLRLLRGLFTHKSLRDGNGESYGKVPNIKYAGGKPVTSCGELLYSYVTCSNNFVQGVFVVGLTLHLNFATNV
ncbi:DDE_3 domain-containing protein [Trichonephila clavipes]|nr:DDE_3 domain-containing protein [Trichonephila clavipes]